MWSRQGWACSPDRSSCWGLRPFRGCAAAQVNMSDHPAPPSSAGECVFGLKARTKQARRAEGRSTKADLSSRSANHEGGRHATPDPEGSGGGERYNFRLDFFKLRRSGMAAEKGPIRVVHFGL